MGTEGFRAWYYSGGDEEAWQVGGNQARIGRNYGGFINAIGILFESPGQDLEEGARAGYLGNLAVVEYAAENAEKLLDLVDAASGQLAACHMTQPGSGHSAAPARGTAMRAPTW